MGMLNKPVAAIVHQFAVTVRLIIEKQGISQRVFAKRTGLSQKTVNNLVQERWGVSLEAAARIAKQAHMPLWQLLIHGRAKSDADATALESVVVTYLTATPEDRRAFDRLTKV